MMIKINIVHQNQNQIIKMKVAAHIVIIIKIKIKVKSPNQDHQIIVHLQSKLTEIKTIMMMLMITKSKYSFFVLKYQFTFSNL
jgi:hypothetical protein